MKEIPVIISLMVINFLISFGVIFYVVNNKKRPLDYYGVITFIVIWNIIFMIFGVITIIAYATKGGIA